jgi:hypothetical protein
LNDELSGHSRSGRAEAATRYEPRDVPAFLPFWLACLLGFFIAVVLVGITIGFPLADKQEYRGPMQALPPAPRLQLAPAMDLQRYDIAKQRELEETRPNGQSIDAAMQQTAVQGWGTPK